MSIPKWDPSDQPHLLEPDVILVTFGLLDLSCPGICPVSCSKGSGSEKSSLSSYPARPQNKDLCIWTFKHSELFREGRENITTKMYSTFQDNNQQDSIIALLTEICQDDICCDPFLLFHFALSKFESG